MSTRVKYPVAAAGRRGVFSVFHSMTIGASGAISSQSSRADSAIVAAKTGSETGRYTLTYDGGRTVRAFLGGSVSLIGADDAAFGAVSVGLHHVFRDNDLDGGAKDGTIELQFLNASTNFTDADLPSGTVVKIRLDLEEGM